MPVHDPSRIAFLAIGAQGSLQREAEFGLLHVELEHGTASRLSGLLELYSLQVRLKEALQMRGSRDALFWMHV